MAEITLETLEDGTPITDELVDKMVADVYASLEKGKHEVMPNSRRSRKPVKTAKPRFRLKIPETLAETETSKTYIFCKSFIVGTQRRTPVL